MYNNKNKINLIINKSYIKLLFNYLPNNIF